jgi:hypothetical protein
MDGGRELLRVPVPSISDLWSGFQPTFEPTAFQAVVVQF